MYVRKEIKKTVANPDRNNLVRLNKFIADSGAASRRKADELIEAGAVKVNGNTIRELGTKILKTDKVTVNGDPVGDIPHFVYIILNKPKDIITTTTDEFDRKTVMDLVHTNYRVFPVGRLDRNTTGLLLLTNDGEMTNRLTHPRYKIERLYIVGLDKPLKIHDARLITKGVELDEDEVTSPCELVIDPDNNSKISLLLKEGKNREVRRMFEKFGYEVKKLDRKMFAGLSTRGLKRGEYRHLTREEVLFLEKTTKLH